MLLPPIAVVVEKIRLSLQPVTMTQAVIVLPVAPAVHQVDVMVLRNVRKEVHYVSMLKGNTFVNVHRIAAERGRNNVGQ